MSRKNFILIISSVILLILGGLIFFYISSTKNVATQTTTTGNINPFGNTAQNKISTTSTSQLQNQISTEIATNTNKLIQLYKNPTSGSVFFLNNKRQSILRFVDRAVGNVYEYLPDSQTGEVQRITNTTIPKIQETVWSNSGKDLILRFLDGDTDNIDSFVSQIKTATSTGEIGELTGSFLPTNVEQLTISPNKDKIFGIINKSDNSGTFGFIENLDGTGKKTVFDSPISYWNISWPKTSTITFNTKPNYEDPGLLYFFNTQNYSMTRILGDIVGLSSITNKNADLVAYSYTQNNSFNLDIYDVVNKINKGLNIPTLADKCVWSDSNTNILYCAIPRSINPDDYPDSWYQGLESFNDDIWMIDTQKEIIKQIYRVGINENVSIDAFNLVISPDDKYLAFTNKNDLSLWLLNINNQ